MPVSLLLTTEKAAAKARSKPSAVTSLPGLWPWLPASRLRSQLLLFKPQELLKWRPCLCSGHVFLPRILGDQQRKSGEKVVSGNWGLETMALVRTNEWMC